MKNLYSRWNAATLIACFANQLKKFMPPDNKLRSPGKMVVLFLCVLFTISHVSAQTVTNYGFTSSNGTFTPNSGATNGGSSAVFDEGVWNNLPIGFDFYYLGTRYTTASASTNGWLTLGASITNASYVNNITTGGTSRPVLAALWDDLLLTSGLNISYVTTGPVGSRIFTLEALNNKWGYNAWNAGISYQVKLYESTGKIEYIYRPEGGALNAPSATIGISEAATGSGNFLSLNSTGATPAVSSTAETSTLSVKPSSGRTYAFMAAAAAAPTALTFSAVTYNGMTLNWADNADNESGYVIYGSTDGTTYSFVTQVPPNTTSSVQTGLTASTNYYWRVYALREGNLGTPVARSQVTPCQPPTAPTVSSPLNYCQFASAPALTATGSNLLWGGAAGSVGGTSTLSTSINVNNNASNRKTIFSTIVGNVSIISVDYYISAYQSVSGLVLSIYNSSGAVVATSTTNTTLTAAASPLQVTSTFNYIIPAAGTYSIGISAGTGNIGFDNPTFPITDATGTVSITGVSSPGYRCFNHLIFSTVTSPSAPVPPTGITGSQTYFVSQTVGNCTSALSSIIVNVTAPNISQVPVSGLIANLPFTGNANDVSANNNPGTLQNAPALVADRFGQTSKAYSFNGTTQYISTAKSYVNPTSFTVSAWFKTATTTGGKLIGFSSSQTGLSGQYDRHVYMTNSGQLYFGIYPGSAVTVNSPLAYNDNKWHLVTATLSSATGMALYVDGSIVGSNSATVAGANYTGYWRIAYDNLSGWPSPPTSNFFNGSLDDILIYHRALTSAEVTTIYTTPDGAGNNGPVCAGSSLNLSLPATGISGASYSWSGPNAFGSTLQNPSLTFTAAAAGTYTVVVTAAGCSSTAYTNVIPSTVSGQWTGNISSDWNDVNNWCSGAVPTSLVNVVIPAGATRMPVITSTASCNNLSIATTATLTTNVAASLNIAGALINSGTMTNNGSTIFNGTTGQQSFTGVTNFNNLEINNTAGVVLPNMITLAGNMTLTAGILSANNFSVVLSGSWLNNSSTNALFAGTSTVTFQGATAQVIGGAFTTTFNNLAIDKTPSTLTLNNNALVAGNLTVTSGTFDLGTYTANRSTPGGTIVVENNAVLRIGGTNTFPVNYASSNLVIASNVEYAGINQSISNQPYGNLKLSSSSGAAIKTFPATALTIAGNLTSTIGAGTSVTSTAAASISVNGVVNIGASTVFNGGAFTHTISGNWVNNGTFNGNTSTIVFNGTGSNVGGAGAQNFNNLTVAASSIAFANNLITLSGNLATTGSGSFSQVPGATLAMTGASKTIAGPGISIHNFIVSGSVSTAASLTITGNLSIPGSFTASAGSFFMSGANKTISGAGSASFNYLNIAGSETSTSNFSINAGLIVDGSLSASAGTATFTGTSTLSGRANLYNAVINGTKLQLSANSVLGIAGTFTISAGILDVTGSIPNMVEYNGAAQNITATTYDKLTLTNGSTKTALSAMTVNGTFTIATGTNFSAGSYTHNFYTDWVNNGTFAASTGTIRFTGPTSTNISGVNVFNQLTVDKATNSATVQLLSDASAATLNMITGLMLTGSKTISLSVTRTGPGIILGNINRTHAFSTGIDYAFEGPNNSINFSSVTGVTSVTVSVAKGSIADFPSGASISRVYNIAVPSGTYTAKLRLHYEHDELNGNDETLLGLWNYNGSVWSSAGAKSGNDITLNYVENSPLTSITNRWTLSGAVSEFTWSGAIDTDWNKPGNWKFGGVVASRIPGSTDVVKIGIEAFASQPGISTAAIAKNIIFGSAKAVTLSMAPGGTLVSGDINGTWSTNATHTLNVNGQSVTINGDLTQSDGIANHKINLNIGNGTLTTTGTLTQSGAADINFTGSGTLKIGTNLNRVDGVFTAGTGTVEFDGSANQTLGNIIFNNLTINKTGGVANASQLLTLKGNLSVLSGTLTNNTTIIIKGNVTSFPGGTLDNQNILQVGGNWLNTGTYTGGGVNVIFNGTGTQSISATTFNNLEINKPVGSVVQLTGDVILKGNLTGISGTLDIKSFFFNRDVVGGTAMITDSATLIVAADNAPRFANYSLSPNSTIIFNGTGTQHLSLPGVIYGNLSFQNSGTKLLSTDITVQGKLLIDSTAIFDAQSNTINLLGNWQNKGTFTPSTSTVVCAGITKTLAGVSIFNNMDVTGSYTNLSNMTYNGLLHIGSTGSLSAATGSLTTLNGDLINNGVLTSFGTTVLTGNVVQHFSLVNAVSTFALIVNFNGTVSPVLNSTSAPQFGYLNINNIGGVNPSVGWTVVYGLTVAPGALFNLGSSSHTFLGNVTNNGTITSDGTVSFLPAGNVTVNFGANFSSTGRVNMGGAGVLTVAGTPIAFGTMNINNTNPAGITPSSDWIMTKTFRVTSGSVFNAGAHTYQVGANLLDGGTFNAGTSTVILNGSGTQQVNMLSPLYNLTLNKTGDSTNLETDLAIGGTLQFIKGKLSTGSFTTSVLPGSSVMGAGQNTGWVSGKLRKNIATGTTSKTFEIGDGGLYTPVNLTFGSVTTGGDLTLSTTGTEHPAISSSAINANRRLNRYFTVGSNGLQYTNCGATFNYVSADVVGDANPAAFQVQLYNGSSWLMPVPGTRTSTSIMAANLALSGDVAIGEICNAGTAITYGSAPYCTTAGMATPIITGTTDGVFSSDTGLTINALTGVIDIASSTLGNHNVVYTISANASCSQYVTSTSVEIAVAGSWTGALNNDWNNPGNWACGGVPASTADVVISSGSANSPVITGVVQLHTITIQPSSSLTVTGRINISGEINNSGIFNASEGTVDMNGTVEQSIPATAITNGDIYNLVVSNSSTGGLTLTSNVNILGSLTFSDTGKTLNTSDLVTIKSTAAKTARIGDLTGNVVNGKVTVERFINTGTLPGQHAKSWQFISVPTIGQTVYGSLQESGRTAPGLGVWITGPAGGIGYDAISPSNSLKYYSSAINNFVGVTNDNAIVTNKFGYYLYVRGDRTVTAASGANSTAVPTVLRSTGFIYQPNNPPPSVVVKKGKFESIGNPYASAIDLGYMRDHGLFENLNNDVTVWDPTIAGSYNSGGYQTLAAANNYMPTTPGAPPTLYPAGVASPSIQSGQGFFVHSSNNALVDGTLNFSEGMKYTGDRLVTKITTTDDRQYFRTYLHTASGVIADGNAVAFDDEFDNVINADDALKIANGGENFGLTRSATSLAVEARKPVVSSDTLYYEMKNLRQASYQLRISPANMDPALNAMLVDKFLNTSTKLSVTDSSIINFAVTSVAASAAADRFKVVFKKATVLPVTFTSISATRRSTNTVDVNWKVGNELNIAGYSIERSENGAQFSVIGKQAPGNSSYLFKDLTALAADNYYRIKSRDADGQVQYTSVVKVAGEIQPPYIGVFPNPVTDGVVRLHFNNQKAGNYTVKLINSIGQMIYTGKVAVSGPNFVKQVQLDPAEARGTYQLEVAGDSPNVFSQQVIVE